MSTTDPEIASMRGRSRIQNIILALIGGIFFAGCVSVPQESVELSTAVGRDIGALKQSYDRLIKDKFDGYRNQRIAYLEYEWIPAFIETWVEDGRLKDVAAGQTVFDEDIQDFREPSNDLGQQELLATIVMWSEAALDQIEIKRKELLGPLDAQEKQVRSEAAAAFDHILEANAQVTAHLTSIRRVKEAQNAVLEKISAKEVIDDLNAMLIEVSNEAENGLKLIRQGDDLVDQANTLLEKGKQSQ